MFGGVQTQTLTNIVSIGGLNGSQITTHIVENSGKATFVSGAPVTGGLPTSFNPLSSVITVGNATLSVSPKSKLCQGVCLTSSKHFSNVL